MQNNELGHLLIDMAAKHGFPLAGALDLDAGLGAMQPFINAYDEWLDAGMAGDMDYLKRDRNLRADPRAVFPDARGVVCVGLPYYTQGDNTPEPDSTSWARYAKYLRGRDYHKVLRTRLDAMLAEASRFYPFEWQSYCDAGPVPERAWAYLAGLGWIGKNSALIHPKFGSFLFLAVAYISKSPGGEPAPMRDQCGRCDKCLQACPTKALGKPRVIDARRCISYWTLVKRGRLVLRDEDIAALKNRIAGCDACQDACPYNHQPEMPASEFPCDPAADATRLRKWEELLAESGGAYKKRARDSALSFVRPAHFRRNLAYALASAIRSAPNEDFRRLLPLINHRMESETNDDIKSIWERCLKE